MRTLPPTQTAEFVRELSETAQMAIQAVGAKLNAAAFERAMQVGYRQACLDNGVEPPTFEDPLKQFIENL